MDALRVCTGMLVLILLLAGCGFGPEPTEIAQETGEPETPTATPGVDVTADTPTEEATAEATVETTEEPEQPSGGEDAGCPTTYTVVRGDTLFRIGQNHGVTVDELVAANDIENPNVLFSGQQLTIPCPSGDGGETTPSTTALGRVRRELDVVEHGPGSGTLQQLTGSADLLAGDRLRVRGGGECLLDFGDMMQLRLFNDSALGVVSAESTEDVPLEVALYLEEGGFTGELTAEGGQAVFETPGGATITVLGTEFFLVYDPSRAMTVAGSFSGTVAVEGAGFTLNVAEGQYTEVPSGGSPGPPLPIPLSRQEFERRTRGSQSATATAEAMTSQVWELLLEWEGTEGQLVETVQWQGRFQVDSFGGVSGEGEGFGTTEGRTCNIDYTFGFEILGLYASGDGGGQFELEVTEFGFQLDPRECEAELSENVDSVASRMAQLTATPVGIQARDGATASQEVTTAQYGLTTLAITLRREVTVD